MGFMDTLLEDTEEVKKRKAMPVLHSEQLNPDDDFSVHYEYTHRIKIPGGWLVAIGVLNDDHHNGGLTFVPDPNHEWDGGSLD